MTTNIKKAIFLIDDDPGGIMSIVKSIFPRLWKIDEEDGIETHICIFGNAEYTGDVYHLLRKKQQELEFGRAVENQLWYECNYYEETEYESENVDPDSDTEECATFNKKINLVADKVHMLYTESDEDAKTEYETICREWMTDVSVCVGNREDDKSPLCVNDRAKECVDKLLHRMNIPVQACVGLDLALLQGDIDRVKENHRPIISMELYKRIKEKHWCFLYSKYVMDQDFTNEWKNVYRSFYGDSDNPVIYQKNEMYRKELSKEIIENLLNMINDPLE
ncbi:MAG: hypothetical protein LUG99_15015 [Lachnospiraceae bacterium]|nr:hypothetical protein [Lachnospiraceae bacterium]